MRDGTYVVYAIEFKNTHESKEWGNPNSKLIARNDAEWLMCGPDYWGKGMDPWVGKGNNRRPRNKKSNNELHHAKMNAGVSGFYTLKYAIQAKKRLEKLSEEGQWDSKDPGTHRKMSKRKYEFRIVKIMKSQKTEEVTVNDLEEAII